ncbi:28S ribosomal protein S7, mitochondrial [Anthophora plagiata]
MILRRAFNSLFQYGLRCNSASSIQFYSVFPPNYVEPVFKKEEQEALFNGTQVNELTYSPIKPAKSSDTCSEFHDFLVRKFINYVMRKGDKAMARKLVMETFEKIKIRQLEKYYNTSPEEREQIILDPKVIFYKAVQNCIPVLELHKVSRGGITYRVPVPLSEKRGQFLSMNWLIETSQEKGNSEKFSDVLATELLNAAKSEGRVIKKKLDLHKQCEANRAYAHYRWL